MHKEELISLHTMLTNVREYLQEQNPDADFTEYDALEITPSQTHRSKIEHKYAIFVLGNAIAKAMREVDNPSAARMADRMHELAERTLKEIEMEGYYLLLFLILRNQVLWKEPRDRGLHTMPVWSAV